MGRAQLTPAEIAEMQNAWDSCHSVAAVHRLTGRGYKSIYKYVHFTPSRQSFGKLLYVVSGVLFVLAIIIHYVR